MRLAKAFDNGEAEPRSFVAGGKGTATEKMAAMEAAGIRVVKSPAEIGDAMQANLK